MRFPHFSDGAACPPPSLLCTEHRILLFEMPHMCENTGSAARDFAMLERNLLSHVRLATLLLLLAASVLLNARLPAPSDPSGGTPHSAGNIPLASIEVAAAVVAIGAGIWEYRRGYQDMQDMKGFLTANKYALRIHVYAVFIVSQATFLCHAIIAAVVFASCIVLISDKGM